MDSLPTIKIFFQSKINATRRLKDDHHANGEGSENDKDAGKVGGSESSRLGGDAWWGSRGTGGSGAGDGLMCGSGGR